MATTYQKKMRRYNGVDFDEYYPVTSANVVKMSDGSNVDSTLTTHMTDNKKHINYVATTGSVNTYLVNISDPYLTQAGYYDGLALCIKINVTNTGASTININGKGAKKILDSFGGDLSSGDLVKNIPYNIRYNGTNFILQGKGGVSSADKQSLIDIANNAEAYDSATRISLIDTVNSKFNGNLTTSSTWNQINNYLNTISFSNIINNTRVMWHKSLNILLIDNQNNYISNNKKYDSDGNLILTGETSQTWNCIDDDNNVYKIATSTDATDKTVTFIKADSSLKQIINKTIDLSNILTYQADNMGDSTDQKELNDLIYINGYIYILISAQNSKSAYHHGMSYIIKLTLDGNISAFAFNTQGSHDYSRNIIVHAGNYLFYQVYGNSAPNPDDFILKYDIANNTIKQIFRYYNSSMYLIGQSDGVQSNIIALYDNYNSVVLRIFDLNFNQLSSYSDFGILNTTAFIRDHHGNVVGYKEIYDPSTNNYMVFNNMEAITGSNNKMLIDKENNLIAYGDVKIWNN